MASKKRNPKRSARIAIRKREGSERKRANDKARLFALSPGGSPLVPLAVSSVAVIEHRARAIACPQCGGRLSIDEHNVDREGSELLRLLHMHCLDCLLPQRLWFRVVIPLAN